MRNSYPYRVTKALFVYWWRFFRHWIRSPRHLLMFSMGVFALFFLYIFTLAAPFSFPSGALVSVKDGASVGEVAQALKAKHLIRSVTLFEIATSIFGQKGVVAGEYSFAHPQSVISLAIRLTHADFQIDAVRVTIPEGASAHEIATILSTRIPNFNDGTFYLSAKGDEGRLYPDTYFFLPGEDPGTVLRAMENNFQIHISDDKVTAAVKTFGKPLYDIITMASILEKEANDSENQRLIAGILWKRIQIGMKLQVDATFPYIIGKNSFELTTADLKVESPYNTYVHKGLPPGPIGNPSIGAIMAAVTPIQTDYLYYLSDKSGNLHYAVTYEQHLKNKAKYLGT